MDKKKKHSEGSKRNDFCGVPGTPCQCKEKNDYRENCKPDWESYKYAQTRKKDQKKESVTKSYQAHHILCIAQVSALIIQEGKKNDFTDIVDETQWCINNKKNMIALPVFGQTVLWYCNKFKGVKPKFKDGKFVEFQGLKESIENKGKESGTRELRPPFRNLPQHDFGHSGATIKQSYNKEIAHALRKLVGQVLESKDKHYNQGIENLKPKLKKLSNRYRKELRRRGRRKIKPVKGKQYQGTHGAWMKAIQFNATWSDWYKPFSMAKIPRPMPFPLNGFEGGMAEKMKRFASALWRYQKWSL